jgi:hypothetical protein
MDFDKRPCDSPNQVSKDLAATVADADAAAEAAGTPLLSKQSKEAAALMGIVMLLTQVRINMPMPV